MTPLPASVRDPVESAIRERGLGAHIETLDTVVGGCINQGSVLTLDTGARLFLKWRIGAAADVFATEAEGLRALRRAAEGLEVSIPEPLACGDDAAAWLLMDFVPPGHADAASDAALGRSLAVIHTSDTRGEYGWTVDNWLGSLRQPNRRHTSWSAFWEHERIRPQLGGARAGGHCRSEVYDRLLEVIPVALHDEPAAALLHGDLWTGNAFTSEAGRPVLIDPAVYHGDREVDIAMTELFGGFGPAFYDAYQRATPLSAEYSSHRRDLYQLYYLLAHVNLFGASYEPGARHAAERVIRALA